MPGPKLTAEQKTALRTEVRQKVDAGTRTPEILAAISAKYGISGETVRYYIKHPSNGARPGRPKAAAPTNGAPRRRGRRSAKAPGGARLGVLLRAVASLSEEDLRRALKAKSVMVEYERVREQERDLARQHREAKSRVKKLKRQMKRLMRS